MPERDHLRRLAKVWIRHPIYFLTVCSMGRRPILTESGVPGILIDAWQASSAVNGWAVGRYVVMPDHAHFFARAADGAKPLSGFMRDWKRWTASNVSRITGADSSIWQAEYFDHVLRSAGSYEQKWDYVRENPVRKGLVAEAGSWPHAGECDSLAFRA